MDAQPIKAVDGLFNQIGKSQQQYKVVVPFAGHKAPDSSKELNDYKSDANFDGRLFQDAVEEQLVRSSTFKVFSRDKLDTVLSEMNLQMSDFFESKKTAVKVCKC